MCLVSNDVIQGGQWTNPCSMKRSGLQPNVYTHRMDPAGSTCSGSPLSVRANDVSLDHDWHWIGVPRPRAGSAVACRSTWYHRCGWHRIAFQRVHGITSASAAACRSTSRTVASISQRLAAQRCASLCPPDFILCILECDFDRIENETRRIQVSRRPRSNIDEAQRLAAQCLTRTQHTQCSTSAAIPHTESSRASVVPVQCLAASRI